MKGQLLPVISTHSTGHHKTLPHLMTGGQAAASYPTAKTHCLSIVPDELDPGRDEQANCLSRNSSRD